MKTLIEEIRAKKTFSIQGGGTRGAKGTLRAEQSGIINYAPEELYITLHAGTPVAEFEAEIAKRGQILPCEIRDHRRMLNTTGAPTLGGAIGVNTAGPRSLRFGRIRELVLGLEFLDGTGELIRTGGVVMKNVTGLDLTKFFVGSRGRLGLATQVTFKLLPKPKETLSLMIDFPEDALLSKLGAALRAPFDIAAAEWQDGKLYLRLEGVGLQNSRQLLENQLGKMDEFDESVWEAIRDWHLLAPHPEIWRISGRPSVLIPFMKTANAPAILSRGGQELTLAITKSELTKTLPKGTIAICEKGEIGARLPLLSASEKVLREKLTRVFDPEAKFGGADEN